MSKPGENCIGPRTLIPLGAVVATIALLLGGVWTVANDRASQIRRIDDHERRLVIQERLLGNIESKVSDMRESLIRLEAKLGTTPSRRPPGP